MESIIIFVIFAIISSVFNKDKKTKRPTRRTPPEHPSQMKPRQPQQSQQRRTTTTASSGRLGDLIKELKGDFDDVFQEQRAPQERVEGNRQSIEPVERKAHSIEGEYSDYSEYEDHYQHYMEKEEVKETYDKREPKSSKKTFTKEGAIYENEIGKEENPAALSFDQPSIVRGIIMAEVLGKPKSMKR